MDQNAKLCLFMGYGDEKFGYRLWDIEEQKIVRSRDVTFLESQVVGNMDKADGK